jgi:hypothetical protein
MKNLFWNRTHDLSVWSTELKLKLNYERLSVGQPVGVHEQLLFPVWQLRGSWCWASSQTRGSVYNLLVKLLLGFARAVTLGSEYRRTRDHVLLSHWKLSQPVSRSQSYFTTFGQSVSQALWGPWLDFTFSCRKIALLFVLGHPLWREHRSVIWSTICQCSELGRTHNHTLLSHVRLLGSLPVASYDSQGLRCKYSYPSPHG